MPRFGANCLATQNVNDQLWVPICVSRSEGSRATWQPFFSKWIARMKARRHSEGRGKLRWKTIFRPVLAQQYPGLQYANRRGSWFRSTNRLSATLKTRRSLFCSAQLDLCSSSPAAKCCQSAACARACSSAKKRLRCAWHSAQVSRALNSTVF